MTEAAHILLARRADCAILTLNRPARMNCLTKAVLLELADIGTQLQAQSNLHALIVTGAGGVFSAGADLGEVSALDPTTAYEFARRGQAVLASLNAAAPVVIAAIDGFCLGGGLDLALWCDLRYAAPSATFQHPGARRGIITGWGGTQRLPRLIGLSEARRLLLTGERIDAAEALRIGLINGIHDDPLAYALQVAARLRAEFTQEST